MVIVLKLVYQEKEIVMKECKSFWSRLKGFMFQKNINCCLYFNHCNSIHTFFMKEAIDVIMCDKNHTVLFFYSHVGPNKVLLPKKGVTEVFELPVGYFQICVNEVVKLIK